MKIKVLTIAIWLFLYTIQIVHAVVPKLVKASIPSWVKPIKKQAKVPDLADISDGYYLESIDYQVNLSDQTRFYRNVKVLSDAAGTENAGQVDIVFDPSYQTLLLHELYVLRDGKKLDRLDVKRFELMASESELSRSIYNGSYSAYLVLEDLRKDDKIVLSYSLKGFNPVFKNRFSDSYFLEGYEPVGLVHVNYVVPKTRSLTFKEFSGAPAAVVQDLANAVSYSWEIAGTNKVEYESDVPYWHNSRQWIQCSEFKKWSDVAAWAMEVNPIPVIATNTDLAKFADKLWGKAGGDAVNYVQAVTNFVQNDIRYMGIEVGEYSHRANTPEKVFAQRFGDCKDKSVLLAAMLKYKKIESELVLANTSEEYGLANYLPTPGAFNHMVVHASVDGRPKMIDPTISNQGSAFFDRYFPFYGKVLIIKPSVGKLWDTDKFVSGNIRTEEKFQLATDGSAMVDVTTVYTGSEADQIRNYFRQTAKNQVEKSYLEYYQRIYKQLKKRSALTFTDDLEQNIFRVEEHYSVKSLVEIEKPSGMRYIGVYASNVSSYLTEIMESRQSPLALSYPLAIEHDIYVINPEGKEAPAFKESSFVDRESYYFGKNVFNVKDTLKIAYRLGFHDTYVKADKLPEYYSDFADKDAFFSSAVYLDQDGFLIGSVTKGSFHLWSVLAFVLLTALFAWLVKRVYHQRRASSIIPLYDEMQHDQIGGWLIVLLIALIVSVIRVFFTGMVQVFFTAFTWSLVDYNYGVSPSVFTGIMIFEFICNTVHIFMLAYSAYLLVKRRDIFPQTLFFTLLFQFLFLVLDFALTRTFSQGLLQDINMYTELIRALIFSIVWGLYIFNSTRVKGTFLVLSKSEQARLMYEQPTMPALPPLPQVSADETKVTPIDAQNKNEE